MNKRLVWRAAAVAAVFLAIAVYMRNGIGLSAMDKQASEAKEEAASASNSSTTVDSPGSQAPMAGGGMGGSGRASGAVGVDGAEHAAKLTLASMSDSQVDRYLIKNAVVLIEAKDVVQAASQAKEFAKSISGYVSNSHESVDALGLKNETLELRVPGTQFDSAMQSVTGLGRVLDSQVTSEDVTEQYVDTDAQLRNLKKTEERLLEHLSRTGKLSDTLLIETELTRVRESLNELEGKLRFMSHRISYSTINLTFKEPAHIEPITPSESFSLGQVATQAMRSVSGFLQQAMAVGVWVIVWSVLWAPLLVGGRYIYVRYFRSAGHRAS